MFNNFKVQSVIFVSFTAFLVVQAEYVLVSDYSGFSFADMFNFFTLDDPNNGYTDFVNKEEAIQKGLLMWMPNQSIYIGVDTQSILDKNSPGRSSVRLESKIVYNHGLFIADFAHIPGSVCGTWPMFFMFGRKPDWPYDGKIHIIEGGNTDTKNLMSLHTNASCTVTDSKYAYTGRLVTSNCYINVTGQYFNQGCAIQAIQKETYGDRFNAVGGGVYATELTSDSVTIWQFPRSDIPEDIIHNKPNPSAWPTPIAKFYGNCDFDQRFRDQSIAFDITFCGYVSAGSWSTRCITKGSSCIGYVRENPTAFQESYWLINSIRVYFNESRNATTQFPVKSQKLGLYIGLPVAILMLVVFACFLIFFCFRKKHKRRQQNVYALMNNFLQKLGKRHVERVEEDLWKLERESVIIYYDKKLGKGNFSDVYVARLIGNSGIKRVYNDSIALSHFCNCKVAVKTLPPEVSDAAKDDFQRELAFMKSLKHHPNLMCLLGYLPDINNSLMLVLEYCSNSDLLSYLRQQESIDNNQSSLKTKQLLSFSWQIANGLNYFTHLGYIHRDIAARNILIDKTFICKIADYGMCRSLHGEIYTSRSKSIPTRWSAIEALKIGEYSMKSDVWSYAVLLFEMFSFGSLPYPSLANDEVLPFLESGQRYTLMLECWNEHPDDRPTFTTICEQLTKMLESEDLKYNYLNAIKDDVVSE